LVAFDQFRENPVSDPRLLIGIAFTALVFALTLWRAGCGPKGCPTGERKDPSLSSVPPSIARTTRSSVPTIAVSCSFPALPPLNRFFKLVTTKSEAQRYLPTDRL
jgi:hypothetical protein